MDLATLDSLDRETLIRLILSQAELIERLTRRVAELEAKLDLPKKTPDNSSTPPSKGKNPRPPPRARTKARAPKSAASRTLARIGRCIQIPRRIARLRLRLSALRRRCLAGRAVLLRGLRSHRDSADQAGRDPRHAAGRNLPELLEEIQGRAAAGHAQGIALRRELARADPLYALYAEHRAGAAVDAALHDSRLGHQRRRHRQYFVVRPRRLRQAARGDPRKAAVGTILQSDETGLRVCKDNWYLWVFHHEDSAVFVAKPTRAQSVIGDFLGDFTPQYWVSDRYAGQLGWAEKENQVCLAHLIRDVQYAIDSGDGVIGPDLRHCSARPARSRRGAPNCRTPR